ncbi:uncharacterized protein LOC125951616 [Anopheles darlingi]|uniref:uncharacterized protein LOC125951616 n=1 Tax=Anopheles darlingi TaxID=43151 RepID=UPI0021005DF0|nr:uncharacterized protein LOC125951616 [Anopheles darlingi]
MKRRNLHHSGSGSSSSRHGSFDHSSKMRSKGSSSSSSNNNSDSGSGSSGACGGDSSSSGARCRATNTGHNRRWWRRPTTAVAAFRHRGSRRSSSGSSSNTSSSHSNHHQQQQQQQQSTGNSSSLTTKRRRYRNVNARLRCCLPGIGTSSALTIALVIALQLLALQPTVLHCAKTFYMHWNTTNSIFRIDNTDHIIDVNKGNAQFEYDQVHIICPVYEPGTFDNETEKYIIYNVSKVEYETCRITNHDPRIIAICDKPNKLMFFTITFRPFTPQPGGLEFLPGNDYYFISTSSKDDLHRRIGGRCTTDNMKVVFKVCCGDDQQSHHGHLPSNGTVIGGGGHGGVDGGTAIGAGGPGGAANANNTISIDAFDPNSRLLPPAINTSQGNIVQNTVNWPVWGGNDGQGGGLNNANNNNGHPQQPHQPQHLPPSHGGVGGHPGGRPGVAVPPNGRHNHHYTASPPRTSINVPGGNGNGGGAYGNGNINNHNYNINSPPSNAHPGSKPTKKTKEYDKQHPNEVVKNEELTYNNGAGGVGARSRHLVTLLASTCLLLLLVSSPILGGLSPSPSSCWSRRRQQLRPGGGS